MHECRWVGVPSAVVSVIRMSVPNTKPSERTYGRVTINCNDDTTTSDKIMTAISREQVHDIALNGSVLNFRPDFNLASRPCAFCITRWYRVSLENRVVTTAIRDAIFHRDLALLDAGISRPAWCAQGAEVASAASAAAAVEEEGKGTGAPEAAGLPSPGKALALPR